MAFDGRFIAEDNFIDLLEGEMRTIAFTPHDNFDRVTVYCYNASKFKKASMKHSRLFKYYDFLGKFARTLFRTIFACS